MIKNKLPVIFVFCILGLFLFIKIENSKPAAVLNKNINSQPAESKSDPHSAVGLEATEANETAPNENPTAEDSYIYLDSENLTSFISRCFNGEICAFKENPWSIYEKLKGKGDLKGADSLIAFLRSQLRYKEYRDHYKEPLRKMIDDFYPETEKLFQEAAYYNYLGDLNRSLELYLELEMKSLNDPALRKAPSLNIANTFYDLGRFKEALPYYQAAFEILRSGAAAPEPNPIGFVETRISEIQKRLN